MLLRACASTGRRAAEKKAPSADEAYRLDAGSALRADYLYELAAVGSAPDKFDGAVNGGKERVVFAAADVFAGVKTRATLAYEYVARTDRLSAKALDAKAFAL